MKNRKYNVSVTLVALILLAFMGCKKDYLDFDLTDGSIRESDVWASDLHSRGFLNGAYGGIPLRYDLGDGSLMASGTDEAVNSNPSGNINIFNNGTWTAQNTIDDQYSNFYSYIRRTNLFLENSSTSAITPRTDIPKLRGEAFFLRALYHFELLERYGGIVLATHSYDLSQNLNQPKSSFDEVVVQIVKDCDSAAIVLPESLSDLSNADKGRATKTAALALESRTLLYAASPLNNKDGDVTKWQAAANAAKAVIDLNKNNLLTLAQLPNLWNYSALAYNSEVIFASQTNNTNTIEINNAPISYDGALGRTDPTQELVNAFDMKTTGKPITDATSGYDPQNPYADRDPRLDLFIIRNGANFKSAAVETFMGGKDNNPGNVNSTRTGYYMRKFLSESAYWGVGNAVKVRRAWVLFRYSEILLNYAEALNEAQGPVTDVYTYINQVRARATMPPLPVGLTKEQMRGRIQNERRVELCFEDQRFFDIRRWKLGEQFLNKPVSGIQITKTGTALIYQTVQADTRIFTDKMYLYPFPQTELYKEPKLEQNPGW
ncbi:hypothetical protein ABIB40_002724 [Pedobacter sp. UYP30]|uniref:RagB/SusD family nutrient uptake outer membrane protein n=1 Tax=Pedobacter sp. UYP30 TaxID=1756400 RepID=UPI0033968407